MKLYYLKGACSLASYISLVEAGQKFEAFEIDRATKKAADGQDVASLNRKGYAPILVLDDGSILTENVAVLSYISTLDASGHLAPKPGTMGFFRVLEWLGYVNSEVHKNLSGLFRPEVPEEAKALARQAALARYTFIDQSLGNKPYLTGEHFTVADAYLYVTISWLPRIGVDISGLPTLKAFYERVRARPAVQKARTAEGLAH
ncbi:MAG: glutathione binding-like protein [Steroidobacteraceae bacterium]